MKDEKNNFKKSYGYTTESGESGSINPLYGVSCAKQGDRLITYGKKSQLTNVHANMLFFVCPENAKIKKINTSVHHIRVKFVFQVPSNIIGIIACIDAWIIVLLYLLRRYIGLLLLCVFIIFTYYIMSFVTVYHIL